MKLLLILIALSTFLYSQANDGRIGLASFGSIIPELKPKRFPSEYYDWTMNTPGIVSSHVLAPGVSLKSVRDLLDAHGNFRQMDDDLLFTFKTGGNIKISSDGERLTRLNFVYDNYKNKRQALLRFKEILREENITSTFIRKNEYFDQEKIVRNVLAQKASKPPQKEDKLCESFDPQEGVSIVPDSHGDRTKYNFISDSLENEAIGWFGFEMIPHTMQNIVDDFTSLPDSDQKYKIARKTLISYYSNHWNTKFGSIINKSGETNEYFKLLEKARKRKIKVYAMDVINDYYGLNPQLDSLVVGTRNLVWAQQLPIEGVGLIFGGTAHFDYPNNATVQDFYHRRAPAQSITVLRNDADCKLATETLKACTNDLRRSKSEARCTGLDDFRCLRKTSSFASELCRSALGLLPAGGDNGALEHQRATK